MIEHKAPPALEGWLTTKRSKTAVEARYASKYSMWIGLDGGFGITDVENLELQVGENLIAIGPCRASHETKPGGGIVRLIPYKIVYDLEKLFFKAKVDPMETKLIKLPLVLGYKDGIDPAFRNYVSDLTYDLNTYAVLLDQLDAQCRDEPPLVRDTIQTTIIEHVSQELRDYLNKRNEELIHLVSDLSEAEQGHHGYYFRRQLWNIILRSPILARTNLKPRGYNGDSEMMQMIYLNDYQGDSTFGKLLHKYSVEQPAAQAVRNRRIEISAFLNDRIQKGGASPDGKVRILSVACGPAFEIRDILKTKADCDKLHVSLLDQDQQALLEASALISKIEKNINATISVDFIRESVRTMLVGKQLEKRWGRFDFIYSMGLFDYLNAPVATAVIRNLYQLLNPNGEMIIGNFATKNPSQNFMEYWHDWRIIYRSEEDFLRLVPGLSDAEAEVQFDKTGIQMLLHISKRGADG